MVLTGQVSKKKPMNKPRRWCLDNTNTDVQVLGLQVTWTEEAVGMEKDGCVFGLSRPLKPLGYLVNDGVVVDL